ncbi:MAG: putative ribonucleotide transport ATP-binding protein mkl [Phycisphaerae bacterium]|nr:putative ribonucleotide transport ATP-binding protein mkl [Phycisphaerae bacterium]
MSDAIIQLVDLHKSFGGQPVLRGVSVELMRGQTTVVLGPSGCGKTVLLKHVIGLLQPDHGRVIFDGQDLTAMGERALCRVRTRFGFLFQGGALFDSMNAVENVMFPLREHHPQQKEHDARARAMECLGLVGLADFAGRMPADLSGGQRKRVALARALTLRPEVLLYDEPTTGLDPIRADVINELIVRMRDELNVTGLVVTHDMASAFKVGDRLIMLHEGQVLADAPADEFRALDEPRVQRFIRGQADDEDLKGLRPGRGQSGGET